MLILRECHKLKILQKFGFQKSSYERPTEKWVCGHRDAGKPCPLGPSGRGACQATFECKPHKSPDGERWECTRPASRGGACEQGPLPDGVCCKAIPKCQPVLSLRAKRSKVVRWVASLAVAFVIILISFSSDMKPLMPGPLASVHSSLKSCANCHANVPGEEFGWMQAIFKPADAAKDSASCLNCHKTGTQALDPHGLARNKLETITRRHQSIRPKKTQPITASFRNVMFPVGPVLKDGVNCATCHKEHQGDKANLTAMSNAQCQSCHTVQFSSFQNGHPEFTKYPYERRTRIIFDHSSHFDKYFPKALADGNSPDAQPGVCADCHTTDGSKGLMVVKNYNQMCSTCHTGQIVGSDRASGPKGITLLALPGLDLEVLREKNADIGEWPEDSEAEISPMMKLLIGWDDSRRKMLDKVGKLDLLDLSEATDDDIVLIEKFVWEMKSLIYQFITLKPSDAMKMLSPKMGGTIDAGLLATLTADMPRDVMAGVQRDWLPNLPAEVLRHMRGERLMPETPVDAKDTAIEKTQTDAADTAATKSADASGGDILSGSEDILAENKSDDILSSNEDILAEKKSDDILSGNEDILAENKSDDILSGNEDILAENKSDDILSGNEDILAEKKSDDILSGNEDILAENKSDDILSGDTGKDESEKPAEPQKKVELPEPMDPEDWAEFGGWYRQDFAVLYKPTGHYDSFMKAWLNYTGAQYDKGKARFAAPVFDMLTDKQAQGQCAKCHSVDGVGNEGRKVNWKPFSAARAVVKFTKFSHEPHFGLFGDKGCSSCHAVNGDAKYLDTYKTLDPVVFTSNFKPVEQQQCTACHKTKAAGESCQLCHVYHMDNVITPIMNTRLPSK